MKDIKTQYLNKIRNFIVLLLIGSVVGLVALLLVFGIPVDRMQQHVGQSLTMLERDFYAEEAIVGYPASNIGSFTDCLMLEHSVYENPEHSLLEQVLYMYRTESFQGDGWAPGESLVDYLSDVLQTREVEYSRYWHGYLVILKPLLYLMSFNAIRVLASAVQFFLVGWIVMQCGQRKEKALGIAFLASIPFLYFFSMYMSLSLSICFYLMAVLVLVQLKWNDKLEQLQKYGEFFFVAGMLTSYFDFLTYPLVTLGFPLCICLYLNGKQWKACLKRIFGYSVAWGSGYLGMWAMKWLLTDILVGGSTIKDALGTILQRTDKASGHSRLSGFGTVIFENLSAYTNWAFYLIVLMVFLVSAVAVVKSRKYLQKQSLSCAGCILLVALFPFVWFFFTQNHSEEHWMFTCKIFSVSVFAFVCAVGKLTEKNMTYETDNSNVKDK